MAKLRNAKPKNVSGAYNRLFGHAELGLLISRVQSTVISSGSELERLIRDKVAGIENLDEFLRRDIMPDRVFLATKRQIKKCNSLDAKDSEPDFIVFKRRHNEQKRHVIEVKDGHVFDTKKSSSERQSLHRFVSKNGRNLPYIISTHFCAFNQSDRLAIWEGFKKRINLNEAMTGQELCDLLEIDYNEIVGLRRADAADNFDYFIESLLQIPDAKNRILAFLEKQ